MDNPQKNTRRLILDTALDIIEREGVRALTQPRIARVAGLRQSHLTYYFPRKADLYIALLDASHERAKEKNRDRPPSLENLLTSLFFTPERMRFFLSIVLEIGDEPELQAILADHARGLCREVAARLGRPPEDEQVAGFIDELRGAALRLLMEPAAAGEPRAVLNRLAARHGLPAFED